MNKLFANWHGRTLYLPAQLRLRDCEAIRKHEMVFPAQVVTINAQALKDIDSIGIAALVQLVRCANEANVSLVWQNVGQSLQRLLALYELNNGVFPHAGTID